MMNVVKLKWINYKILDVLQMINVSWMIHNVTERYFFFSYVSNGAAKMDSYLNSPVYSLICI